ncbi:YceD family protein [Rhodoblastus sp.]|uniref:YceD family protein n=1 Tax=Rhodoblastus sp. TaxID=1962975 RepID=UPI003F956326
MTEACVPAGPPPFSRPVAVETVGDKGLRLDLAASAAECAALAEQDGLVALRDLRIEAEITRRGRDRLRVAGRVRAVVTQHCVVTMEPFDTEVEEPFEVEFAPEAEAAAAYARAMAEIEAAQDKAAALAAQPDPPDPIVNGRIDLGALAAEFLALGLDPYPRKPGVRFDPMIEDADEPPSPFAALAKLKKE